MNLQEQKSAIRSEKLALRDAISPALRIEKSLAAAELSAGKITFDPGTIVSGFLPLRSEIDPRPLLETLRRAGARLCLPAVVDRTTIAFRILVRGADLVNTGFGTMGPDENAAVLDPQVLIIPLSAFDLNGGRIGYGAGHYDRAILRLKAKGMSPRLIGLAFDCQRTETVPVEDHDQPLEAMITESGYVETGAKTE